MDCGHCNFSAFGDNEPTAQVFLASDNATPRVVRPVRVVLGHFIFVYIHPYMEGDGQIGQEIHDEWQHDFGKTHRPLAANSCIPPDIFSK